ncbi:MAG: hypothetical protein LKM36_02840 [Flavobacteriales bacterium]|jgi:hypothetical protein|nr:hypothetical protein [Flavobacteriales bacterium]
MKQLKFLPAISLKATALLVFCACSFTVAQAGDCEPAHIDSVITNSPICSGDHVNLAVVAEGDIIGYSWEGPGTGEQFSFSPEFSFLFPVAGNYTVIVYGECGNDTATVTVATQGAGAGNGGILQLCDNGPVKNMEIVLGPHDPGGAWTYFGEPHSGVYDPAIDQPGPYTYTVPDTVTCPGANQSAAVAVQLTHVGPAQATSICEVDSPVDLSQSLTPGFTADGLWHRYVMLSMEPHSAEYDPVVDSSGVFFYVVAGCTTTVTVTEDIASPWFNDEDHDGLGDPLDRVMACSRPAGFVQDSTDACVAINGTVGTHCDDGNTATIDDVITEDCECLGVLWTTVQPVQAGLTFAMWPNPFGSGQLNIAYGSAEPVEVQFVDLHGRMVLREERMPVPGEVLIIEPPAGLAKGAYLVRLISADAVMHSTLVVQ